jgi:hypothetical protein
MKPLSNFRYYLLTLFGKPACDREIYKTIRKFKIQSIVEIGLGDGKRAETMIQVAQKFSDSSAIRYTGIDLFEARETEPKLPLREIHKKLTSTGAKCQLVPGDVDSAIARIANSHLRTDLIVISADDPSQRLEAGWFYFPRMLHATSLVLSQGEPNGRFQSQNRLDIEKRSQNCKPRNRAAA